MISKKFKILISAIFLNLMIMNTVTVFAYNSTWSAQSISNFLYNKVDAPNVLKDEKYHENITREEFAELIVGLYAVVNKIDKNSIIVKENIFKDTNSIDIQRAYSLGIVNGKNKNEYFPKSNITREEISTMIMRFLNIQGINTTSLKSLKDYKDIKNISKWAFDSMAYCVNEGIINGFQGELQPKEVATVQQVIIMLDRVGLKNNWITDSKDMYINGFFVPKDTKFYASSYNDGMYIEIPWDNVDDIEKLRKDLKCSLIYKIKSDDELNKLINYILGSEKETFKEFNIDGYTINVVDIEKCPYLQIYPKQ